MQKNGTYRVTREYDNQYGLEELIRRVIRCHLRDECAGNTGLEFTGHKMNDDKEQQECYV